MASGPDHRPGSAPDAVGEGCACCPSLILCISRLFAAGLIFIFFGLGALVMALVAWMGLDVGLQLLVSISGFPVELAGPTSSSALDIRDRACDTRVEETACGHSMMGRQGVVESGLTVGQAVEIMIGGSLWRVVRHEDMSTAAECRS